MVHDSGSAFSLLNIVRKYGFAAAPGREELCKPYLLVFFEHEIPPRGGTQAGSRLSTNTMSSADALSRTYAIVAHMIPTDQHCRRVPVV